MPTIIDSLIVQLGMDAKKFKGEQDRVNKGLKDTGNEAKKTGDKLNQAGKDGAKGFAEASNGLGKLMSLMAAGYVVKKFVTDMVNTNAEIYRFSRNLQQNAKDISAWGNAVEVTGGDARAFRGTLTMLSKAQTELQMTGQSGLIPYFSRFNVAMMDVNGNARKGTDILLDLADRMQGMDRTTAFNTLQAMGIDEGTANAMLEGRKSLQALIDKQKEQTAVSNDAARQAEETRKKAVQDALLLTKASNDMTSKMLPAIQKLLEMFDRLNEATNGWAANIASAAKSLGEIGVIAYAVKRLLPTAAATATAGEGVAAAAGGGAAAAAGRVLGVGGALLLHSGELNAGEDERMKQIHAMQDAEMAKRSSASPRNKLTKIERKYGLPQGLLDRIWYAESGRGKSMKSPAGAEGHFQFMPATAKQYGLKNPYDFDESADAAGRMFRDLIKQNGGDVSKAIAAYNWGQGNLMRKGVGSAPKETRDYHQRVLGYALPGAGMSAPGASQSTTVAINEVKVYTQATDANGIARDFRAALNTQMQYQANTGLGN